MKNEITLDILIDKLKDESRRHIFESDGYDDLYAAMDLKLKQEIRDALYSLVGIATQLVLDKKK